MNFLLNGMNLHTSSSQPVKDSFISKPDKELFKINTDSVLPGNPISHLWNNFFIFKVQRNRRNIIFSSLPDLLIINSSISF